jgi:DNA polymerase I-like protein with 3'-5' exonuclease and polymerase domains
MYRVHSIIDMFTVTGRMLFNDPCLQNIPKDFSLDEIYSSLDSDNPEIFSDPNAQYFLSKLEEEIDQISAIVPENCISMRSLFIPSKDRVFVSADYCQLEFRIITNLCKDETLVSIFKNTQYDVFVLLASKWLGIPIEKVDEEKRQNVKKVNIYLRF